MATAFSRLASGRADRPHWAARVEDAKNALVGTVLRTLGCVPRLQPFDSYASRHQVRILARVMLARPGAKPDHYDKPVQNMHSLAGRGFRNFMGQPEPFHIIHVDLPQADGSTRTVAVQADRSGIVDTVLDAELEPGIHNVVLRSAHAPNTAVTTTITVIDDRTQRVGVVSDIDDTVVVTILPRPLLAFWNAFVVQQTTRRIVSGMPVLYQQIRRAYNVGERVGPGAGSVVGTGATSPGGRVPFIYLSTGAWNVSPVLSRFLFKNGYPVGPMLLTDWGPTNTGFFRSGTDHKKQSLERLAQMFPAMQWILIGDDGQHDPDTYSTFVTNRPDRVKAVAIRELSANQRRLADGGRHPLRAIRAAVRSGIELVPGVGRLQKALRREAPATTLPESLRKHAQPPGDGQSPAAQPSADARHVSSAHGIPWVSSQDGFGLIKRLREHDILPE